MLSDLFEVERAVRVERDGWIRVAEVVPPCKKPKTAAD
jgi:hypothetical protein